MDMYRVESTRPMRPSLPRVRAAILALAALSPLPLAAQQRDTIPRDTSALRPVVVTGVRLPTVRELASGLAGRTATLTAQELDARGVKTLADALEQLPGVTTADEFGAPSQLDVTLRGFQVSPVIGLSQGLTVYIDGVRANEPDANEVNFDLLPLEDVQRVDVVYGPSVLLGRNSLGAAVNLVTTRGSAPGEREIEVSGGSFGRYELKAHAGDRVGQWDYYLGGRYEHEDGWREATSSRLGSVFVKVGVLNETWDATLSYTGADNSIHQAGSLPESLAATSPTANYTPGDYFAPQAHLVTLNAQRRVGGLQLAFNIFGRMLNSEQFNANLPPPDSRQLNRTRVAGAAAQLTGTLGLLGRPLRWLAGADGDYSHTGIDISLARSGQPDSLTESARANQVDAGLFLGASWPLTSALALTLAGRYDGIRIPFEDLLDPSRNGVNEFRQLSPRVGLAWTDSAGHTVSASLSRGFRAPALLEIACGDSTAACALPFSLGPDPALKPVVATTYELGWRYHHAIANEQGGGGALDLGADVYRTDVQDDIYFVAATLSAGYFDNISATRRAGVEASAQWLAPSGVRLYANYGYTAATFETSAVLASVRDTSGREIVAAGDRLPMVPRHRVNAGVSVPAARDHLRAGLDARYVSPQVFRGDESNVTEPLPDYLVLDASLELRWHRYDLRLMVPNVLDRSYATYGTYGGAPVQRFVTPGLPRRLLASLSADF